MVNQKLISSQKISYRTPQIKGSISLVKQEFDYNHQNYIINRIKLKQIEISEKGRDAILKSLSQSRRFIQLGKYTIMLNTISSIEPLPVKEKKLLDLINKKKKELGIKG